MDDGLIPIERRSDISKTVDARGEALAASGRPRTLGAAAGWAPPGRDNDFARSAGQVYRRLRALEADLAGVNAIVAMHPDPILLVNAQREIVLGNAAAYRLFGGDMEGCDLAAALTAPAILDATDRALRNGRTAVVDFALGDPVERHFRCRIGLLADYAETGRTALLTMTDFTEVKRSEKARADFVANASHELRTPLAILMGFIETLTGSAADDPEAQQRFLPIMQQQAARMARLVDDLLSLSRIELTEHAPPTAKVKLPPLVRGVSQALRLRAAERGMRIELSIARNLPAVIGDPDELSQVFQNLIDNAIKYAAPNTAIIVTATHSSRLPRGVQVSVRDRGEGIAARHLSRLTERFYRVDTARSCAAGGTGLGLAIVKHVLTRHRGQLDIESQVGEGSTFTVHLSALAPGQPAESTSDPSRTLAAPAPDAERPPRKRTRLNGSRRPIARAHTAGRRLADDLTTNSRKG